MNRIRLLVRNLPGWTTNRKIVVFESDDWGSIRIGGEEALAQLISKGVNTVDDPFLRYDGLESNSDLKLLFEVLRSHKDHNGNNPVFTSLCVVANPAFERIEANGFCSYEYESFVETCKRYPEHDKVLNYWLEGIESRLFIPQFHGREHLNITSWMDALRRKDKNCLLAFSNKSIGIADTQKNDHLAAFRIKSWEEIDILNQIIGSGVDLFQKICGYKPRYFVPPNNPGPSELETILYDHGLDFINSGRYFQDLSFENKLKLRLNWPGKHNQYGQVYLTRNCFFEPVISESKNKVWLNDCLTEIKSAFRLKKPAVISTHRVNYTGLLNKSNRQKGLSELDTLLKRILSEWPEAEFLTSVELGELMNK